MKMSRAKGAKAKADRLFSQIIRAEGSCENCGERDPAKLQCAHIISRRYANTRTDLNNAVVLCAKCHLWFTNNPVEFGRWILDRIGDDAYNRLREKAQSNRKVDWVAELERLQQIAATIGVGS